MQLIFKVGEFFDLTNSIDCFFSIIVMNFFKKIFMERIVPYRSSLIHFEIFGTGENILLCFHGYGEDGSVFSILEKNLGNKFKIIAIDLPFHGKTNWKEGLNFNPLQLIQILQNGFGLQKVKFSILGYSMGGRIALQLLQLLPQNISKAVFIAPDGLHKNLWYQFSISPAGNSVFYYCMKHPAVLKTIMNTGNFLKIGSLKNFSYYIDTSKARELLYKRWTTLRQFKPDLKILQQIISSYKIPVRFLYGLYDTLIESHEGEKFIQSIAPYGSLIKIQAGHKLLKEKYTSQIASLLT